MKNVFDIYAQSAERFILGQARCLPPAPELSFPTYRLLAAVESAVSADNRALHDRMR